MASLNTTDIAYFAGYFDGEGCIVVTTVHPERAKQSYRLDVSVTGIVKAPIERFHQAFGGTLVPYPGYSNSSTTRRPIFRWAVQGKDAIQFLSYVLPYLVVKREQALVALTFPWHPRRGKTGLSDEDRTKRGEIRERLRELKREAS